MTRILLILCFFGMVSAFGKGDDSLLKQFRKDFPTASSYSHKKPYSIAIKEIFIFYDSAGNIVGGAALRPVKTYETLTGVMLVSKKDMSYTVKNVLFTDLKKIRKPSEQRTVLKAAARVNGIVVMERGKKKKLDAVSGATRYNRYLFVNLNKMASVLVDEMAKSRKWPKISLLTEAKMVE